MNNRWYRWMEWKLSLCKWCTFWMVPCSIYFYIVILLYTERKWLFMGNIITILPLKSKLSGKFLLFNSIDGRVEMLQNSWLNVQKFQLKWKFLKHFTRPKQRAALRKLFSTSPYKSFLLLPNPSPNPNPYGDLQEYTDICFPSASRMQFLGV